MAHGAGEIALMGRLFQKQVQHHLIVVGIGPVSVAFPIPQIRIKLDVALQSLSIDLYHTLSKIRTR